MGRIIGITVMVLLAIIAAIFGVLCIIAGVLTGSVTYYLNGATGLISAASIFISALAVANS